MSSDSAAVSSTLSNGHYNINSTATTTSNNNNNGGDLVMVVASKKVSAATGKCYRASIPPRLNCTLNLWSFMRNCIGKELTKAINFYRFFILFTEFYLMSLFEFDF